MVIWCPHQVRIDVTVGPLDSPRALLEHVVSQCVVDHVVYSDRIHADAAPFTDLRYDRHQFTLEAKCRLHPHARPLHLELPACMPPLTRTAEGVVWEELLKMKCEGEARNGLRLSTILEELSRLCHAGHPAGFSYTPPPPPLPLPAFVAPDVIGALGELFPEMKKRCHRPCPLCGSIPPLAGGWLISEVIMHLNDAHSASREYIADWLDNIPSHPSLGG